MELRKGIVAGAALAIAVGVAWFWPSDKREIRKRFHQVSETVSIEGESTVFVRAGRREALGASLTDPVRIEVPDFPDRGEVGRDEMVNWFYFAMEGAERIYLEFDELGFESVGDEEARVRVKYVFSLTLRGDGEAAYQSRGMLRCVLRKVEGRWLIREIEEEIS